MRKLWTTPFDVMPIILAVLCVGSVTQISIASFAAEAASASESSLQQTIEARPDLSMGGVSKPPERPLFDAAAPVPVWPAFQSGAWRHLAMSASGRLITTTSWPGSI